MNSMKYILLGGRKCCQGIGFLARNPGTSAAGIAGIVAGVGLVLATPANPVGYVAVLSGIGNILSADAKKSEPKKD